MSETIGIIIGSITIIVVAFSLIAIIPVIIGKLLFRWSGRRVRYVLAESMSTVIAAIVGSLVLTGLILLIGKVFNQKWAFSGGLLLVYVLWISIKAVKENITASKGL